MREMSQRKNGLSAKTSGRMNNGRLNRN